MSTKRGGVNWDDRVSIRTDATIKASLSLLKARLGCSRQLTFRGRRVSEEAIFGALMLWAQAQGDDGLVRILSPYMDELERLVEAREAAQQKAPAPPEREVGGHVGGTVMHSVSKPRGGGESFGGTRRDHKIG